MHPVMSRSSSSNGNSRSAAAPSSANSAALEERTMQLSALEAQREEKRRRMDVLFHQSVAIKKEMNDTEEELMRLDEEIGNLEGELREDYQKQQQQLQQQKQPKSEMEHPKCVVVEQHQHRRNISQTQGGDILTDPLTMDAADNLTSEQEEEEQEEEEDEDVLPDPLTQVEEGRHRASSFAAAPALRPPSRTGSSVGPLELVASKSQRRQQKKSPPPPPTNQNQENSDTVQLQAQRGVSSLVASKPSATGTLDAYFGVSSKCSPTTAQAASKPAPAATSSFSTYSAAAPPSHQHPPSVVASGTQRQGGNASAMSRQQQQNQQRQQQQQQFDPLARFRADNFPWSQEVDRLMRDTFRIASFRDNQKEIINATLSREDVFVIMRTGGGKSLTYQLPALVEGRGPERKVTFVISPLLSLIQDQEEQMNQFVKGSALSFTSGLQGGTTEHARRWGLVRDPTQGVCLVFVTPEKVNKSNKLKDEMQKLYAQNRLGRFCIDEAHSCSQDGHDFRPDYTQLGILKAHFPDIPLIAVTATASDRVRKDVCNILRLGTNYHFFRSTANRPNLHYSVRPKRDGKNAVTTDMAAFIKEHHPRDAGIVYTFSRKDANDVADQLCACGIIARAYHSDVTPKQKELIHRSWMQNNTQVVVATIAFGLGINKPDVRFVLHHTISKTLDAYYQESGRAGRDGNAANCVLYYSPRDVPRMLKMVHGSHGENLLWNMVRYAQTSGNDAVCKAIMMAHLGEPICEDIEALCCRYDGVVTENKDVGRHCQIVARLLQMGTQDGKDLTISMLVKEWRSKSAPQFVKDYPPTKDGLTVEDCERIIIALVVEDVFAPNVIWGAYDSIVYLRLGTRGSGILQSPNPKIFIRFPKREDQKAAAKETKQKARTSVPDNGEWLTAGAKPKAAKRQKKAPAKKKAAKKKRATKTTARSTSKTRANQKPASKPAVGEVIDLYSDDESDGTASAQKESPEDELWNDAESSDSELEFEG